MLAAALRRTTRRTVIPAKVRGAANTVSLLEQTPHSLLWDFDAIAYMMMGVTTLAIIPALGVTRPERWVRVAYTVHADATVLAGVVYFHSEYSKSSSCSGSRGPLLRLP